jgi:hypothetical protein
MPAFKIDSGGVCNARSFFVLRCTLSHMGRIHLALFPAPTITGRVSGTPARFFSRQNVTVVTFCGMMVLRAMVLGRLRQRPPSTKSGCSILPIVRDFTGRSNEGGVPHHLRAGSRLPRPAFSARMHSRAVALKVGWEFSSVLYPSHRPPLLATACNFASGCRFLLRSGFLLQRRGGGMFCRYCNALGDGC